ncbi:hypothetical protein T492DRAFT_1099242 [Pavlovales sp. CCMP2436]|nr:hypothetical protein T492DRAFT_1099242 [Pavlovales sp. CCMP2436]
MGRRRACGCVPARRGPAQRLHARSEARSPHLLPSPCRPLLPSAVRGAGGPDRGLARLHRAQLHARTRHRHGGGLHTRQLPRRDSRRQDGEPHPPLLPCLVRAARPAGGSHS